MNHELSIPSEAQRLADHGDLIGAIKITREQMSLGLKEAKDAVEAYLSAHPAVLEQYRAKRRSGGWRRIIVPLGLFGIAVFVVWWLLFSH